MWEVGRLYEHPGGRRRNRKTGIIVRFITLLKSPDPAREACRLRARCSKVPLRAQINTELASHAAPAREEQRGRKFILSGGETFRKLAQADGSGTVRVEGERRALFFLHEGIYLFLKLVYTPLESPGSH